MNVRYLVVHNPSEEHFRGVAVLHADYRTRAFSPVIVRTVENAVVPSRLVNEVRGAPESDGKCRWTLDLEFFCDCPARSEAVYVAQFGQDPASFASDHEWESRTEHGRLSAQEQESL